MGRGDEGWNRGVEIKRTKLPFFAAARTCSKAENSVLPQPAERHISRALSWPRGGTPDPPAPPGELWNRRQKKWIRSLQPLYPKQKKKGQWQALLHTFRSMGREKKTACQQNAWITCGAWGLHACKRATILGTHNSHWNTLVRYCLVNYEWRRHKWTARWYCYTGREKLMWGGIIW